MKKKMKKSDKEKSDGNKDMQREPIWVFIWERPAGRLDSLASSLIYAVCAGRTVKKGYRKNEANG